MSRALPSLAAALVLVLLLPLPTGAGDEAPRIVWFDDLGAAWEAAATTGRPLFIALHRLPRAASPRAAARLAAWIRVYPDPDVVTASRAFACVRRFAPALEGNTADEGGVAPVTHLVLDGRQQVLLREDADVPGPDGARALARLLRRGADAFGPIPDDAPVIDAGTRDRTRRAVEGASSLRPVALPVDVPGLRLRLRWELPAPELAGAEAQRVEADVLLRWDGVGPFPLGSLAFAAGEEVDVPVDLRFEEIEGLAPLLTEGTHRLDLYLEPRPGSYPFSRGPLHVGRVWVELGQGGGRGADSAPEPEADEPDDPEAPQPVPDGEPDEPEPPPPSDRTEVVDPFVRDGETVQKEDAIVAVEDPDSAVKPPRRVPLEDALRDFEKVKERAVADERIAPRDRDFLRLYFEALERAARERAREAGR